MKFMKDAGGEVTSSGLIKVHQVNQNIKDGTRPTANPMSEQVWRITCAESDSASDHCAHFLSDTNE